MTIKALISRFIFPTPRICPLCQSKQEKLIICSNCVEELNKIKIAMGQCQRCGTFGSNVPTCPNCSIWPKYLKYNIAALPYTKEYREVLHLFKFRKQGWLAPVLADLMTKALPPSLSLDLIIPVPLHKNRLYERGFNQSALLAQEMARNLEVPFKKDLLLRQLDTPHQTGLDLHQRKGNLQNAFKVTDISAIKDKTILLIDDTITTGSTLLECAKTLSQAQGKTIIACTLAAGIR